MKITVNGKDVFFDLPVLLSDAAEKAGFPVPRACAGRGLCGACAVYAEGALSDKEACEKNLPAGIRLSCKARAVGDCVVTVPARRSQKILSGIRLPWGTKISDALAVDVGTTTIVAALSSGGRIYTAAAENPQRKFGDDVVSRLLASETHGEEMRLSTAEKIRDLSEKLLAEADCAMPEACVCGNTAMLYILTGTDASPLGASPFMITECFGGMFEIPDLFKAYIPRCVSAFIGADALCAAFAASLFSGGDFFEADVGTNCEMALYKDGALTFVSSAAGSAFAETGAPASEVIETLYEALSCGAVDARGTIDPENDLVIDGRVEIGDSGVFINEDTLRGIRSDKAAIRTAADILTGGETPETLYLAGAVGGYTPEEALFGVGLFPRAGKTVFLGNAALSGALAAVSRRERFEALARKSRALSLTEVDGFGKRLVANMDLRIY